MMQILEQQFDCYYIDRVGHTAAFPVTDNWQHLVAELIDSIKVQTSTPVIGIGHSLGGVLSLMAAIQEPALFKMVILLDSPLINRLKSEIVRLGKRFGFIDRLTPASRTRARLQHWTSKSELMSYLKSRSLFKTFTDACLDDYIYYGMEKDDAGYSLRFDPQIEYQIYRTMPHVLKDSEGLLTVPAVLLYGDTSTVVDLMDRRYMKKQFGIQSIQVKGSHMFPMEYPEQTAQLIINVIKEQQ